MNDIKKIITDRLTKLENNFVVLLNEINDIKQLVTKLDVTLPLSNNSTSNEDAKIMMEELEKISKELPENVVSIDSRKIHPIYDIIGPRGVFSKYLSPAVITCGKGFIRPIEGFPQHEDDILNISPKYLLCWPNGFYRNAVSKNEQFLLQIENIGALCLDKLPDNNGNLYLIDCKLHTTINMHAMDENSISKIKDRIEVELIRIMNDYSF